MEKKGRCREELSFCWRRLILFVVAIRTFIVRCIFIMFATIAIWNVVIEKSNLYWLLLITLIPLFIETVIGIHRLKMDGTGKGVSMKWFSPVVLLFLVCGCPPIWIMELTIASNTTQLQTSPARISSNGSTSVTLPITTTSFPTTTTLTTTLTKLDLNYTSTTAEAANTTISITTETPNTTASNVSETLVNLKRDVKNDNSGSIIAPLMSLTSFQKSLQNNTLLATFETQLTERVKVFEQVLLLTLIITRWILPRGGITRDQLSQLLLVNIGMAADILELFDALKEDNVRHNILLNLIILSMWQASLFQFTLTKTVTKARKIRPGFFEDSEEKEAKFKLTNCICCKTELWAIATSLLLQDVPFFCLRMTLIFRYNIVSYSNIFFTCKNALVILLQLFRSYVIIIESFKKKDNADDLNSFGSKNSMAISSTRLNIPPINQHKVLLSQNPQNNNARDDNNVALLHIPSNNNNRNLALPKASPEPSFRSVKDDGIV